METETDAYPTRPSERGGASTLALYVVLRADEPLAMPTRHGVDDVDAIHFRRGHRGAAREVRDGLRRLIISIPDRLMSADHGQLVHARRAWMLDARAAKNGALVRGERTHTARVEPGDVWVLGHTVFRLAREARVPGTPLDLEASGLTPPVPQLATFDPALAHELERLARIAPTELAVLIRGETGTGKEVVARSLHALSGRSGAFVAVNCGAIAPALVESELFGHRKGAFSGATSDRPGFVRSADKGTLFLDEIAELPLPAQTVLLRVLQESEVTPVGDSTPIPVDLRVCAATHRDLPALVAAEKFREDLYARLLGLTVSIPPLRDRRADLGLLVASLLRAFPDPDRIRFTPAAAARLAAYDWPRNVRELERALVAGVALAGGAPLGLEHLAIEPAAPVESPRGEVAELSAEDRERKAELEELLRRHSVAEIARRLGKDRTQIYRWMRRFGIARKEDDDDEDEDEADDDT